MPRPYVFLVAIAVLAASCVERDREDEQRPFLGARGARTGDGRVVLVTIDGARWQDVLKGTMPAEALMPRTHALVRARGVALGASMPGCGTVHTAGRSNLSLPGYIEIFTGHASRCLDNDCASPPFTVLDEAAASGVPGVASIGSWEPLARAVSGIRDGVFVSTGRTWPGGTGGEDAELADRVAAGNASGPSPGKNGYRPDVHTAAIALAYLRAKRPSFLHVGLGDTDELGHAGDYPGYLAALRTADTLVGAIADTLDTMGEEGARTTVIVTPDHGRAVSFNGHGVLAPESGRTFLLAFGGGMTPRDVVCPREDVTLADIAPTIRVLLGLPSDTSDGAGKPIEPIVARAIE